MSENIESKVSDLSEKHKYFCIFLFFARVKQRNPLKQTHLMSDQLLSSRMCWSAESSDGSDGSGSSVLKWQSTENTVQAGSDSHDWVRNDFIWCLFAGSRFFKAELYIFSLIRQRTTCFWQRIWSVASSTSWGEHKLLLPALCFQCSAELTLCCRFPPTATSTRPSSSLQTL